MTELVDLSLVAAASLIGSRQLSPLEVTEATLSRIQQAEPAIGAFVCLDAERALEAAAERTREMDGSGPRGPLHGIPVAIKDVMDVAGLPTRAGSAVLAEEAPAREDAPAVAALREAGAVILGKVTTHEFAFGLETPPTRNPWDVSRIAGGSSGGPAAALAAGECFGALGTDSGGSIRMPSAFCGTTGLRPRLGIVPLERTVPFSWTHDTCGPMARTAADVAVLWHVMSSTPLVEPTPLPGVRVAVPPDSVPVLDPDPEVAALVEAALNVMEGYGAKLVPTEMPRFDEWDKDRFAVVQSDLLAAHIDAGWYPARKHLYGEDLREYLTRAEGIRGADLVLARRRLDRLARRFRAALDDADVIAIPTAVTVAPRADVSARPAEGEGPGVSPLIARLIRSCAAASYCGLVAASLPVGNTPAGLPVGLQLIGHDEESVLGVALAFQQVTDHHEQRAPAANFLSAR